MELKKIMNVNKKYKFSAEGIDSKKNIFLFAGVKIDNLSLSEAVAELEKQILKGNKGYAITPNAAYIYFLHKNKELMRIYNNAGLSLPDGMSLIFASRLLGNPLKERCSGHEFFVEVCKLLSSLNKSIFLLGGRNGSEKIAERKLKKIYPDLRVDSYCPPFGFENNPAETAKIIDTINDFNSDILFLFVGAPKSEIWLYRNFSRLKISYAFTLGNTINYFAETMRRAPGWMQKAGLEWVFRFCQEPARLWRRYLVGNIFFVFLFFKELFKKYGGKKA